MSQQLTGPAVVAGQGIFATSATALHDIGAFMVTNDGRGFRYGKAAATAIAVGRIIQAKAEDTSNEQELTITNVAVGDTTVVTTDTVTLAADLLAGGFLIISEGTLGTGTTYNLKGNSAASSAVVTFRLEDGQPIRVASTGTCKVDVKVNPYMSVIVAPTTQTSCIVGATQVAVPASEFAWFQTKGVCAILAQGTVVVGDGLVPANTTTAGTVVSRADASLEASIGTALHGCASTDFCMAMLNIA